MTELRYVVPGKVACAHRPRVTSRGTHMDAAYVAWKRWAHAHALAAVRAFPWPTDARYGVEAVVVEHDRRSRDLDNAIKGVLDGARGVLWDDDRQIDRLTISRGAVDRDSPRVEVRVWRLSSAAPRATQRGTRARAPREVAGKAAGPSQSADQPAAEAAGSSASEARQRHPRESREPARESAEARERSTREKAHGG